MKKPAETTPLLALLRACDKNERKQIATWAGTSVSYMYALGSCCRGSCRADLAASIEDASRQLNRRTDGRTPVVTMRELATMCPVKVAPAMTAAAK